MADPIAVYGAITGTAGAAAAAWTVWNGFFRDRARIETNVSNVVTSNYPGVRPGELLCAIDVMNHGRRPVTISSYAGLTFPKGRWAAFAGSASDLPRRLDEGSKVTFWVYEGSLLDSIRQFGCMPNRVLVNDDAGRAHKRRIPKKYLRRLKRLAVSS